MAGTRSRSNSTVTITVNKGPKTGGDPRRVGRQGVDDVEKTLEDGRTSPTSRPRRPSPRTRRTKPDEVHPDLGPRRDRRSPLDDGDHHHLRDRQVGGAELRRADRGPGRASSPTRPGSPSRGSPNGRATSPQGTVIDQSPQRRETGRPRHPDQADPGEGARARAGPDRPTPAPTGDDDLADADAQRPSEPTELFESLVESVLGCQHEQCGANLGARVQTSLFDLGAPDTYEGLGWARSAG